MVTQQQFQNCTSFLISFLAKLYLFQNTLYQLLFFLFSIHNQQKILAQIPQLNFLYLFWDFPLKPFENRYFPEEISKIFSKVFSLNNQTLHMLKKFCKSSALKPPYE